MILCECTVSKTRVFFDIPWKRALIAVSQLIDKPGGIAYNERLIVTIAGGGVAQLVRAHGSYPCCRRFESVPRYQTSLFQGMLES